MRAVSTTFSGAGSALYLGLGFYPDYVDILNIEEAQAERLQWDISMIRESVGAEGIIRVGVSNTPAHALLTVGNGIAYYDGGDKIVTASANYLVPVNSIAAYRGDMRNKTGTLITDWTLTTSGSQLGKFNTAMDTTYVGVGSVIEIEDQSRTKTQKAAIVALSNDGDADDDITLNRDIASGPVRNISYKLGMYNAPAGRVMPKGIVINDTSYVNVSGQVCRIIAGTFDHKF